MPEFHYKALPVDVHFGVGESAKTIKSIREHIDWCVSLCGYACAS